MLDRICTAAIEGTADQMGLQSVVDRLAEAAAVNGESGPKRRHHALHCRSRQPRHWQSARSAASDQYRAAPVRPANNSFRHEGYERAASGGLVSLTGEPRTGPALAFHGRQGRVGPAALGGFLDRR